MRRAVVVLTGLCMLAAAPASAAKCGPVDQGPSPAAGAKGLAVLEPNGKRASLTLELGGGQSDADDVTLATKGGAIIGSQPKDATAGVRDSLRKSNDRFDGTVVVTATPLRGAQSVALDLCVDGASKWQAGTFEGTATVDGPRLAQFAYPISVTKKWPWWVAFAVLLAVVLGYVLYSVGTGNPAIKGTGARIAKTLFLAVSIGGGLLAYWSVYTKNPTWGENPSADIVALALGGLTGAIGGGTAARMAFTRIGGGGEPAGGGGGGAARGGDAGGRADGEVAGRVGDPV